MDNHKITTSPLIDPCLQQTLQCHVSPGWLLPLCLWCRVPLLPAGGAGAGRSVWRASQGAGAGPAGGSQGFQVPGVVLHMWLLLPPQVLRGGPVGGAGHPGGAPG